MNRRQFLLFVSLGGIASYFPLLLKSGFTQKSLANTPVANDDFILVGTTTELAQEGQIAKDKILVIASPSNPEEIIAVNPTCTHRGCTVKWKEDKEAFVCPCHKSNFASDGSVLKGPAKKPLAVYETKLEGEQIFVKKD